jgi:hypothetical protein
MIKLTYNLIDAEPDESDTDAEFERPVEFQGKGKKKAARKRKTKVPTKKKINGSIRTGTFANFSATFVQLILNS